jgi:hypothetical protein
MLGRNGHGPEVGFDAALYDEWALGSKSVLAVRRLVPWKKTAP